MWDVDSRNNGPPSSSPEALTPDSTVPLISSRHSQARGLKTVFIQTWVFPLQLNWHAKCVGEKTIEIGKEGREMDGIGRESEGLTERGGK